MNTAELISLEREVEAARERVAGDLARLRAPATLSEFKNELWAETQQLKNQAVEKTTGVFNETVQGVLSNIKGRAAANPAAALAIGAGLAWRLLSHPPIASLLVGAGVVGLMKTAPARNADFGAGLAAQASDVATALKEQAQEWGAQASETALATVSHVTDNVSALADGASETLVDAREAVTNMTGNATSTERGASAVSSDTLMEPDTRDQLLLGAAALAIAAAVGIASRRRLEHMR
jgi:hypothetical protein